MSDQISVAVRDEQRATAARSEVYKILSAVFSYPATDQDRDFVVRGARQALREAAAALPFALPAMELLPEDVDSAELEFTYTRLFDNCSGRAAVSLNEKDYSRRDPKEIWEGLIRFYEHFGLSYELKVGKEWPDWIGMELEFLHYLTFLEAGAPDDVAAGYAAAEADFLDRHLAAWTPQLSAKLGGMPELGPYGAFSVFLAQFVEADAGFNRARRPGR